MATHVEAPAQATYHTANEGKSFLMVIGNEGNPYQRKIEESVASANPRHVHWPPHDKKRVWSVLGQIKYVSFVICDPYFQFIPPHP